MAESVSSILTSWSSFYTMTGSAAASLTGLMFVVITLVTGSEHLRKAPDGLSAFSTPTVVHFCAAFLVSAILNAPWRALGYPATLLGLAGLVGVAYLLRVTYLTRRLRTYRPDLEDWTWYTVLPFIAYGAILTGAIAMYVVAVQALFVIAGGVVLLTFIGIRNAWDVVTFIATGGPDQPPK